jgi:hypothetical protein
MAIYHLHKWFVTGRKDPYMAPEQVYKRLVGYRDNEDKQVTTSAIVNFQGRKITTYSGSIYFLEDIDPDYLQWMIDNSIQYDPENPIKGKNTSDQK